MEKFIEGIIYINLDRREDRKREIERQFQRIEYPPERIIRFPAIDKPDNPAIGCSLSHSIALKEAYERNWSNVLILEDDFNFIDDLELVKTSIEQFFNQVKKWDAVILSYCPGTENTKPYNEIVSRLINVPGASGYLVNRNTMIPLSNLIKEGVRELERTGEHWIYANDRIWNRLMEQGDWFIFKQRLGYQRASYSDLSRKFIFYG